MWKPERWYSPEYLRSSAKVQTTADLCFAYPGSRRIGPQKSGPQKSGTARTHEDCGVTSERTF